jgi:hypothetical protein
MELSLKGRTLSAIAVGSMFAVALSAAGTGGSNPLGAEKAYAASAASVKAVKVTKQSGKYSVTIAQTEVGKTSAAIQVGKKKALKKLGVATVKVSTGMAYGKKQALQSSKTIKVSKLSSKKNSKTKYTFPALGSYTAKVTYCNKNGKVLKKLTVKKVGVAAEEYNIAVFNGTMPSLIFTMSMFDETDLTKGGTVPTYIIMSRPDAYDWDALPKNVYSVPLINNAKSGKYATRRAAMRAYVKSLHAASSSSKYNFYCADNGIKNIFDTMYQNGIDDDHLTVHMLTDGSGSAEWFKDIYNTGDANPYTVNKKMAGEWRIAQKAALAGDDPKLSSLKYVVNDGKGSLSLSKYAYAALSCHDNYDWWITYAGNFASSDASFVAAAKAQMNTFSISNDLTIIEKKGNSAAFKQLYHLSDTMFAKAIKEHKKPMVIMGTRVTSEKNFEPFVKFLKKYYGDEYEYYYKGHPGTPTKYYPDKEKQLEELGVTDIDSSIAAELIIFYNPDIYVSGLSNSTLNSSYQKGHTLAYLGTRLADKDRITSGDLFHVFFTKIDSSYEDGIKSLVKDDPELNYSYLAELNDGSGTVLIYDANADTITKFVKDNGTYKAA